MCITGFIKVVNKLKKKPMQEIQILNLQMFLKKKNNLLKKLPQLLIDCTTADQLLIKTPPPKKKFRKNKIKQEWCK